MESENLSSLSPISETLRSHNRSVLVALDEALASVVAERPDAGLDRLVSFLKDELLSHARAKERALYPVIESLLKIRDRATATMSMDHDFFAGYIRQIEELAQTLRTTAPSSRVRDEVMRLLLQLQSLLRAHVEKEERIYLPLLEQYVSGGVQQNILRRMQGGADGIDNTPVKATLDIRWITRYRRHALLRELFNALAPSEAITLVDDHDPKRLCSEFENERAGALTWEYLERGPKMWRVRISKL